MNTVDELKSQIKNLIIMIINKERKNINKWKNDEGWIHDDGFVSDIDTFYYLFHRLENEGGDNNFMDYVKFINDEDPFNNGCKWKSIKKKNEFFNTFISFLHHA